MRIRCLVWVSLIAVAIFSSGAFAEPEEDYYAVLMEGKKVGHAVETRVVEAGRVTTTNDVDLTITRGGVAINLKTSEANIETMKGEPIGFSSTMDFGIMKMGVTGTVTNGKVNLEITSMGQKQKQTLDWPKGAVMAEGLRLAGIKKGLAPGTEYTVKVYSPSQMMAMDVGIKVEGKEQIDLLGRVVKANKVTNTYSVPGAGKMTSTSYVDDDMQLLKDVMPMMGMNIVMLSCTKEFAMSKNDVFEFIDKMFVDSPRVLDDLRGASSATYWLKPIKADQELSAPSIAGQTVTKLDDGVLKVTVRPAKMPTGVKLPYTGDNEEALEALKPTAYVQSDRKEIIDLAKKAIGDTNDAGKAAKKIEAFVADYIDNKDLSVGYASAAEVAQSRQGDCSEFAVLTAALCRAVGIPAEVATGIVYVKEFAGFQNRFGGHAWTMVYIGDKWVCIDSAFASAGLGGYDPGHIMLAYGNGDPGGFFELATSMGMFTIEKVETKK